MSAIEACRYCGVLDALERHDGACPHALELGLPRLAEGEDPINPAAEDAEAALVTTEPQPLPVEPVSAPAPYRAPQRASAELWISHTGALENFDAVVWESELDALRYAVAQGCKVRPLEMGRSLREQTTEGD